MTVQLTPQTAELIRRKVADGGYASADELIHDALLALDEQARDEEERLAVLRAAIARGDQAGDEVEFTPELGEQLRREALQLAREGRRPNPDVCP